MPELPPQPLQRFSPARNLFVVTRPPYDDKPPCDEAFRGEVAYSFGDDIGYRECWLATIDDVGAFVTKYGQCTVWKNLDGFYAVEIGWGL